MMFQFGLLNQNASLVNLGKSGCSDSGYRIHMDPTEFKTRTHMSLFENRVKRVAPNLMFYHQFPSENGHVMVS